MPITLTRSKVSSGDGSVESIRYATIAETDTDPAPIELTEFADRSVQVDGTFNGGTLTVEGSNDGLVYVNDRQNNRVQVFDLSGKYLNEVFIDRNTKSTFGTSFSSAFSADPEQRFLYVADLANFRVAVLERKTLKIIPEAAFGHAGLYPGQFLRLHLIATDSKGNVYTSEANGARVQKWKFTGMAN